MNNIPWKQKSFGIILVILTVLQLVRIIIFVSEYGGLEHDGGWLLGVSRSLAERGTFTTMVSTIVDPDVRGGINVDYKFDVQDNEGRIWFYTANSVGPLVFLVNAFFLKIFGVNFWSLHVGSLLFFVAYLLLASAVLLRLENIWGALLFQVYLWFYPHLSIFLGYEALGEVPGMVAVLLAYLAFMRAITLSGSEEFVPNSNWLKWCYLSGLLVGLAVNTKLIALLSLAGMGLVLLKRFGRWPKGWFRGGVVFFGGILTIPVLWESVQFIVLSYVAGLDNYWQNLLGRFGYFFNEGSGLGARPQQNIEFLWAKFLVISEISHPDWRWASATFMLVTFGGLGLIWLYRRHPIKQDWILLLWGGWLANMIWFIGLGKTGWVRHAWLGLILAVLLLVIMGGELIVQWSRFRWPALTLATIWLVIFLPGFWSQRLAAWPLITPQLVETWRQKQIDSMYYSRVPWMITPRVEQERVVQFLQQLPPQAHVYYPANHKAAEIAVQVGKNFYPLLRRQYMTPTPKDVVIVGTTLISPWKDPGIRHSLIERTKVECPNFLYESEYYIICRQW